MSTEVDSPNRSGCRTPENQMSGMFSPGCVDMIRIRRMTSMGLDPTTEPCLPGDISILSSRLNAVQIERSIQRALDCGFTREQVLGPNAHRLLNEMDCAPRVRRPRTLPDGTKDYSRRVVDRTPFPGFDECLPPIQPAPETECTKDDSSDKSSLKREGDSISAPKTRRKSRAAKPKPGNQELESIKDLDESFILDSSAEISKLY